MNQNGKRMQKPKLQVSPKFPFKDSSKKRIYLYLYPLIYLPNLNIHNIIALSPIEAKRLPKPLLQFPHIHILSSLTIMHDKPNPIPSPFIRQRNRVAKRRRVLPKMRHSKAKKNSSLFILQSLRTSNGPSLCMSE